MLQRAKAAGAGPLMVVDYHESRRALALAELSACFAELVASPTDMKVLVDPNL